MSGICAVTLRTTKLTMLLMMMRELMIKIIVNLAAGGIGLSSISNITSEDAWLSVSLLLDAITDIFVSILMPFMMISL